MGDQPGEELPLDLFHGYSVTRLGPDDQRQLEAGHVLGQSHIGHVALLVDPCSLHEAEHAQHGLTVDSDRAGCTRTLRQDLHVGTGIGRDRYDHVHQPSTVLGRGVDHHRASRGHRPPDAVQRLLREPLADMSGLGVAVEDGIDHVVR